LFHFFQEDYVQSEEDMLVDNPVKPIEVVIVQQEVLYHIGQLWATQLDLAFQKEVIEILV
jgi:hypothetical protein